MIAMDTSTTTTTTTRSHVLPTYTRTLFSESLSRVYKSEVSLYSDLVDVVQQVNKSTLANNHSLAEALSRKHELNRLDLERHGAIRLGSPEELSIMARFLGTMGMVAVGYYDLTQAGLPIHAACFRTTDLTELAENPLRLFVSLLKREHISAELSPVVREILGKRNIFSPRVEQLISISESHGGLTQEEANELVTEGVQTFRWRSQTTVPRAIYEALLDENPILADIVAFQGPHINHLTPRALDIDAVQACMRRVGLPAKQSIEGPPKRHNPILLRQTSYYAQREHIVFADETTGFHTARFGEIEERGAALTPKGRALYDALLESATAKGITAEDEDAYALHFAQFPDDWEVLRSAGLVWVQYSILDHAKAQSFTARRPPTLEGLVEEGIVGCEPIIYEDFLPISAAGIFQSNLKDSGKTNSRRPSRILEAEVGGRSDFAEALGGPILDEMELYEAVQEASIALVWKELGHMAVSHL